MFPTFIIAGLGMVAAGLVLNVVQFWSVFSEVGPLLNIFVIKLKYFSRLG